MALPQNGSTPGAFKDSSITTFVNAVGTAPRILADVAAASGNLLGGQRIYDVTATSNDTVANAVTLYEGYQASLYTNMGAVTITGTNAINRTVGSFVADGWMAGDTAVLAGSATNGNNQIFLTVTMVAALVLTFSGTLLTNDTEAAGFRMLRVAARNPVTVAAGAGVAAGTTTVPSNTQLLGTGDSTKDTTGLELGGNSVLLAACYQAVSASKTLQILCKAALR